MKCCCPVVIECIGAFRRRFSSQQILELEPGPQREYTGLSASIVITLLLGKGGGGKASTVERVKRVERVESHRFLRGLTCDTNIYVQLVHVRKKLFMYL